jgi:hypothetical protein
MRTGGTRRLYGFSNVEQEDRTRQKKTISLAATAAHAADNGVFAPRKDQQHND